MGSRVVAGASPALATFSNHKPHTIATVEITKTFKLIEEASIVSFEYVEHSQDYWHTNQVTDVEIDKETAQKIIDFLSEKFKITT